MPRPSERRTPTNLEFGRRIRARRVELGWSQERLAHTAELSAYYTASIERGERSPSLNAILRLCAALNLDVGALLRGLPPPK